MALAYEMIAHPDGQFIDVSQNAGRCGVGAEDAPCLIPKARLMTVSPDREVRMITGVETMALHGFPASYFDLELMDKTGVTESLLRDLAGNSFQGYVYATVLVALLSNLPKAHGAARPPQPKPHVDANVDEQQRSDFLASLLGV